MKAVVRPIPFPQSGRLLAVSDVHGNLPWLKGLLDKVGFTPDDALVLVGDLVEKGPDSLATLRYVMELSQTHTVHALCGNCDNLAVDFVDQNAGLGRDFFRGYLSVWKERSLITQMAMEIGAPVSSPEDLPALRAVLREQFAPELDFLRGLPTILTAPGYVFVHGGVPSYDHMEELDAWKCMKNDDFLSQGHAFPRYCVVGHWPVTLYRPDIPSAAPLLLPERHIASIDGGCCLKLDGQLNALVLPAAPGGAFSWFAYDGLPTAAALDAQAPSADSVNVRWGRNALEVLERGRELSRCRHLETGRVLDVLTEYLYVDRGVTRCEDSTDYRLEVRPGDTLSVVRRISDRALVKKDGVTGWYFGRME